MDEDKLLLHAPLPLDRAGHHAANEQLAQHEIDDEWRHHRDELPVKMIWKFVVKVPPYSAVNGITVAFAASRSPQK
jgi:hypothetical protein